MSRWSRNLDAVPWRVTKSGQKSSASAVSPVIAVDNNKTPSESHDVVIDIPEAMI